MNIENNIKNAINKLGNEFNSLDLSFHKMKNAKPDDVTSYFPGEQNEDILICVFKGKNIHEPFHRQDFFFINYAYKNNYQALSEKYNNLITIHEDECYIGQPYSGYALRANNNKEVIIIGVLIRKDTFFHDYLPIIYSDSELFKFFTDPKTKKFSDEFIHLSFKNNFAIKYILELMITEYANKQNNTQQILKSMLQILILEIAREYKKSKPENIKKPISEQIINYIEDHSDNITLQMLSKHFGYHPNYISSLLHKKAGKTFSNILLESRMKRAVILMKNTNLSIEEISALLGYENHSNFYKAFKEYFGVTPRKYNK